MRATKHAKGMLCTVLMGALLFYGVAASMAAPQQRLAELVQERRTVFADAAQRQQIVAELRNIATTQRAEAVAWALRHNLPMRVERDGLRVSELMRLDEGRPLYYTTLNKNAAISTCANLLQAAPYLLDGSGGIVGVWDAGSVRVTHQEFGGRVTAVDGAPPHEHSTHVGGIIGAAGINANAKGMAPSVSIDSYEWNSDLAEMAATGMSYPLETGKIQISNHSYGIEAGWAYNGGNATPRWTWHGNGGSVNDVDINFGRYSQDVRDIDTLAYNLPWYQVFIAAGNDRSDNPVNGETVQLTPYSGTITYDSSLHPKTDSTYRDGFDTMSFYSLAKNVISVGSVNDAVNNSQRDLSKATISSFTSWGPTDDGRVKPDLMANGYSLYSTLDSSDTAYGNMSGTSMATPNAVGTAQLILQYFGKLFPGHAMRASTLKALLIHTADDLNTPGPDYKSGWGLINGKAACDLLANYRSHAGTRSIIEDLVATNRTTATFTFIWDGISPLKATLCWTDPPGSQTTSGDNRTARLVNNLDLALIAPDETVYLPWVMPFVGNWSVASCNYAATIGSNSTDNVEQVLVAAPAQAGAYTAKVTWRGTLVNGAQPFSLIVSGMAADQRAPAPQLLTFTPNMASGTATLEMSGSNFMLGAHVVLRQNGQSDVPGSNVVAKGGLLAARFNTSGMANGWWRAVVRNPDDQRAILWNAFAVPGEFFIEDFESGNIWAKGWSSAALQGSNQWTTSTVKKVSATHSMFAAGPATKSDTALVMPPQQLPSDIVALRLVFWHDYIFTSNDGGVLEFSLDGGTWFDVEANGSGTFFGANGYTGTLGFFANNPLGSLRRAWLGSSSGFQQVIVSINDINKFAGKSLSVRWRLGTNSNTASTGWYVDDVALLAIGAPPPPPPAGTSVLIK